MHTFEITEQDRRAIRFTNDKRKTMCTREEAKSWLDDVVEKALRDLRYRWQGPTKGEAESNGADPSGLASVSSMNGAVTPESSAVKASGEISDGAVKV